MNEGTYQFDYNSRLSILRISNNHTGDNGQPRHDTLYVDVSTIIAIDCYEVLGNGDLTRIGICCQGSTFSLTVKNETVPKTIETLTGIWFKHKESSRQDFGFLEKMAANGQ